MIYAKVQGGAVLAYPYSIAALRRDHPNVSFPIEPTEQDIAPFGVVPVTETKPSIPAGKVAKEGPPAFVSGVLTQTWIMVDAPVPASVTPAQAKLALLAASLLDSAEAAITNAGPEAQIYWSSALSFERNHPLILSIGAALGLTKAQIDDLFRDAATR